MSERPSSSRKRPPDVPGPNSTNHQMRRSAELRSSAEPEQILAIARTLLADLSLDSLLPRLVDATQRLTRARHVALRAGDGLNPGERRYLVACAGNRPRWQSATPDWMLAHQRPRGPSVSRAESGERTARTRTRERTPDQGILRVPVRASGRLYATLHVGGQQAGTGFTERDREMLVALAGLAAPAIEQAARHRAQTIERTHLEQRVQTLEATREMAQAIAGRTDLGPVLTRVAEYARTLVNARGVAIEYLSHGRLVIAAVAGEMPPELVGMTRELDRSLAEAALHRGVTLRLEDDGNRERFTRHGLGALLSIEADAGLAVPLTFMGRAQGVLMAIDRIAQGPAFSEQDRLLLEACAESAAAGIGTAQAAEDQLLRERLATVTEERLRWGRELHDETLQGLAAMRLRLAGQLWQRGAAQPEQAILDVIAALDHQITHLRALILDLRQLSPETTLAAALGDLAQRTTAAGPRVELDLAAASGEEWTAAEEQLSIESSTAIYRICHEALVNAANHAEAKLVSLRVAPDESCFRITVTDDGAGFDPHSPTAGFGLIGMRERAELVGGTVQVSSSPGQGTVVVALIPLRPPAPRVRGNNLSATSPGGPS